MSGEQLGGSGLTLPNAMQISERKGLAFRRAGDVLDGEATRWFKYQSGFYYRITPTETRIVNASDLNYADFIASDYTTYPPGCEGEPAACNCDAPSFGSRAANGLPSSSFNPNAKYGIACGQVNESACGCEDPVGFNWGDPVIASAAFDFITSPGGFSANLASCTPPDTSYIMRMDFTWRPPETQPPGKWVALLIYNSQVRNAKVIGEDVPFIAEESYYSGSTSGRVEETIASHVSLQIAGATFTTKVRIMNLATGIFAERDATETFPATCVGSGS